MSFAELILYVLFVFATRDAELNTEKEKITTAADISMLNPSSLTTINFSLKCILKNETAEFLALRSRNKNNITEYVLMMRINNSIFLTHRSIGDYKTLLHNLIDTGTSQLAFHPLTVVLLICKRLGNREKVAEKFSISEHKAQPYQNVQNIRYSRNLKLFSYFTHPDTAHYIITDITAQITTTSDCLLPWQLN